MANIFGSNQFRNYWRHFLYHQFDAFDRKHFKNTMFDVTMVDIVSNVFHGKNLIIVDEGTT